MQYSFRPSEPKHDKTSKMICAPSEDSDQTGHPSSLTRVFAVRSVGNYKDQRFLHAENDDWDQTGRMPGLSEYSLGEQVILLDLSCSSSLIFHNGKKCTGKLQSMSPIYLILQNT